MGSGLWFYGNKSVILFTLIFASSVQMPTEYYCFCCCYYYKNSFYIRDFPQSSVNHTLKTTLVEKQKQALQCENLCKRPIHMIHKFRLQWPSSPMIRFLHTILGTAWFPQLLCWCHNYLLLLKIKSRDILTLLCILVLWGQDSRIAAACFFSLFVFSSLCLFLFLFSFTLWHCLFFLRLSASQM